MPASLSLVLRRVMLGKGQNVSYTGTAGTIAAAMPGSASSVMIWITTVGYVSWGADPTATTADLPLPANTPIIVPLDNNSGKGWKVSAVQAASGGTLYIIPLTD